RELHFLSEQEKKKATALAVQMKQLQTAGDFWRDSLVQRLAQPTLLLDAYQRILSCNTRARILIAMDPSRSIVGQSWHDLRQFSLSHAALERSLDLPNQPVEWKAPDGFTMVFESAPGKLGTYISFFVSAS